MLGVLLAAAQAGARFSPSLVVQGAGRGGLEHWPVQSGGSWLTRARGTGRPLPARQVQRRPPRSLASSTSLLLKFIVSRNSSLCRSTWRMRTATPARGGSSGSGRPAVSTPPAAAPSPGAPGTVTGRSCMAPPSRSGERRRPRVRAGQGVPGLRLHLLNARHLRRGEVLGCGPSAQALGAPRLQSFSLPLPAPRTGLNRTLRRSGPAFFCETRPLGLDKLHCALKSESLSHGFITRHHCPPGCWAQVPGLTVEGRAAGDPGPLLVPGLSGPACPSWPALPACLAHSGGLRAACP